MNKNKTDLQTEKYLPNAINLLKQVMKYEEEGTCKIIAEINEDNNLIFIIKQL